MKMGPRPRKLAENESPELKHLWAGHAPKQVSEHYTRLAEERDFRLMWAEKIGLGFELPNSAKKAPFGQLVQFRKAV
jgi:hypothetical protein